MPIDITPQFDTNARVRRLENELAALRQLQNNQSPERRSIRQNPRLARTIDDGTVTYPTSGATFPIVFLDGDFLKQEAAVANFSNRQAQTATWVHNISGEYIGPDTILEVWQQRGIGAQGSGEWWTSSLRSTDCFPIEVVSGIGQPNLPPYGCFHNTWGHTDDIVNDAPSPIGYTRRGFRFYNGVARYTARPLIESMMTDIRPFFHLALNGATEVEGTGSNNLGTGYLAAECPAWGLLYDGFSPSSVDAEWFNTTWGPIFHSVNNVKNYDLWPGVMGFRPAGLPDAFSTPGGTRYRCLFIRDLTQQMVCRAKFNWVNAGAGYVTSELVKRQVGANGASSEVYDGSDASHPDVSANLRHPDTFNSSKSLNVLQNDLYTIRMRPGFGEPVLDEGIETIIVDELIGTLRSSAIDIGSIKGWGLADGNENAPALGGSGLDATARMLRYWNSGQGGLQGGAETHTHELVNNPDPLGNNTTFFQTDSETTLNEASSFPPYVHANLYERLGPPP